MEIILTRVLKGDIQWEEKRIGVVFVKNEDDIKKLHKLLVEQDEDWSGYKGLIRVSPVGISSEKEIIDQCEWVGKTRIYHPDVIRQKVDFIFFQYTETSMGLHGY